ncbi:MAG: hypothetical protein M5U01_37245 [Ardenticatenaceae bacterium]|nr:hypothetical protein [Ardenticatenaceae bacterium]HBY98301.1 hypothetical protein [Chloroflexota bacterium]
MKVARTYRARSGPVPRQSRRWLWFSLVAVLLVGGILAVLAARSPTTSSVAAEHTFHDFGRIGINDGLVIAQFPLVVQRSTQVTDVQTS